MEIIKTGRLVLRAPIENDIDRMVETLADFSISRNLARIPWPYHRDDALDFLMFVASCDHRSRFSAICRRDMPDQLIGMISYEWNDATQNAELGYWLDKPDWGQGLMTEAAAAMVKHAFSENRHPALVASFHDDNPASGRILSRVGFERLGASTIFSRAQGKELPVTSMKLTRNRWLQMKNAGH
jgi:[ribosomal protein S5]-alanine N-acetyltransferase